MFSSIPPTIDSVFRYTNGLIYFCKHTRDHEFGEFKRATRKSDIMTLSPDIFLRTILILINKNMWSFILFPNVLILFIFEQIFSKFYA